jgi:hypothetical protein
MHCCKDIHGTDSHKFYFFSVSLNILNRPPK